MFNKVAISNVNVLLGLINVFNIYNKLQILLNNLNTILFFANSKLGFFKQNLLKYFKSFLEKLLLNNNVVK